MTKLLICLDTDGTLETSGGLVMVSRLLQLGAAGVKLVVVSPSPNYPKDEEGSPLFELRNQLTRSENLRLSKERYPSDLYLYVSDNGDNHISKECGFVHVHPNDFR